MFYRTLSAPLSVQIELTTECTNCCPHCYNYQKQDSNSDETLPSNKISTIFLKLGSAKVPAITITGGEPLLKIDSLLECIRCCNRNGIRCSINSNLIPLTTGLLEKMLNAGKFSILTSIASYDEKTHDAAMGRAGAFIKTVSSISLLRKYEVDFSINMVVSKINADQVYHTGIFAHSIGAKMFAATKASPPLGCRDYSMVQPSKEQVKKS